MFYGLNLSKEIVADVSALGYTKALVAAALSDGFPSDVDY